MNLGLRQMFYKTTKDFSEQYDINEELIIDMLLSTVFRADDLPKATLLGFTEIELLKKLDLWISVEGYNETEDPRNIIYIIYNNI